MSRCGRRCEAEPSFFDAGRVGDEVQAVDLALVFSTLQDYLRALCTSLTL